MIRFAAIASSLVLCATPSIANEIFNYQPQPVLAAQPLQMPGRTIDILGIQIGMTVGVAKSSIEKALPGLKINTSASRLSYSSRGVTVQTPDFVSDVTVNPIMNVVKPVKVNEALALTFSGPASGNQLIAAARRTTYSDVVQAPAVEVLKKALIDKYGPPSFTNESGGDTSLSWTFIGGEQRTCAPKAECSFPTGEYSPSQLATIAGDQSQVELAVFAKITNSASDLSKVSQSSIFLGSATRRKATAKADLDSLKEAAQAALAKASQNVSAPKL
ncbi:hypothetical protein OOZ54_22305 [Rhodopseudomonas palustris]|uniref:hypothetical protein n=1 Tax=Rhodopseudomonas palustris TaxID=1076 RepID=UPI0022F0D438|nr:hypothetical protein [Rhodopseudomonas palustris]WBU29368.1 hypothetical protein OOZ54_22305 [Rhodopseudomonas palustris]